MKVTYVAMSLSARSLHQANHPQLDDKIKQTDPKARSVFERDLKRWESALERFRGLMSYDSAVRRLKAVDVPSLEEQIHDQDKLLPSLAENSEKVLQYPP